MGTGRATTVGSGVPDTTEVTGSLPRGPGQGKGQGQGQLSSDLLFRT